MVVNIWKTGRALGRVPGVLWGDGCLGGLSGLAAAAAVAAGLLGAPLKNRRWATILPRSLQGE